VWSDSCTEVSGTANTCTDESAVADIKGIIIGMSKHIITKSEGFKKRRYVDAAGVIRRLFILPGEVFLFF